MRGLGRRTREAKGQVGSDRRETSEIPRLPSGDEMQCLTESQWSCLRMGVMFWGHVRQVGLHSPEHTEVFFKEKIGETKRERCINQGETK